MSVRGLFLQRLRGFLATHDIARGEFGTLAVQSRKFVRDIEKGAPVTLGRIEAAERFMCQVEADPAVLPKLRRAAGLVARKDAAPAKRAGGAR